MPGSAWTQDEITLRTMAAAGKHRVEIAAAIGRTPNAVRMKAKELGVELPPLPYGAMTRSQPVEHDPPGFEIDPLPSEVQSADELIERRKRVFRQKAAAKEARRLIPVRVNLTGPVGIMHMGDPHIDDDGTDIGLLERHVAIAAKTKGMMAGNVGDYQNNWVGRLARLHGEQSTSARESWVLVEWLIRAVPWLYLVGGNHDAWSGAGDPLQWIARQQGALLEPHGARLGLTFPSGREIRTNARHSFPGSSQWNPAHGIGKAVQMGARDHILTCGHTHVSGYMPLKDPQNGLISHALQIASYKTYDRYAEEKNFRDQTIFVAPVTIVDPKYADDDPRLVTVIFDPEEAADYLTFKRSRKAA